MRRKSDIQVTVRFLDDVVTPLLHNKKSSLTDMHERIECLIKGMRRKRTDLVMKTN